ncbi:uncharacterized protein [Ptychodera flava]|uniref:uncharacterized protein n=1 Tax=Ptychodera flava TaxID=63121 RepID=UPI003969ED7F
MLKLELSCLLLAFVFSFGLRLVWSSGISEPEGDPETTMSTAEQPESETEPASEFESPFSESEDVIAETRPSVAEFLLPPFVLIFIIVTALGGLMVTAQWRKRKRKRKQEEREITEAFVNSGFDVDTEKIEAKKPIEPPTKFITRADLKVIDSLDSFFNQPMQLLKISLPAVLSLAFCPLLLQIYGPLTRFFWPASQYPNGMPPINEAIACFLAPAGLVYAVTFGFTFQSAVEKQKALLNNVSLEVSLLDQIIILASQVPLSDENDRVEIYRAVKDEIISIMQQIQIQSKRSGFNLQNGPLWKIVPIIRKRRYNNQADTVMAKEMIKHLLKMNTARSERHEAMSASFTHFSGFSWKC